MNTSDYEMTIVSPNPQISGWDYLEIHGIRKAIDLCKQFFDEFGKNSIEHNTSIKLGRILLMLEKFAQTYPQVPQELKYPAEFLSKGKLGADMVSDERCLDYVMQLYVSLLQIDKRKGVPPDYFDKLLEKEKQKKEQKENDG